MAVALTADVQTKFRSPLRKLVRFFEGSRDKWKQKCADLRKELKRDKNQVRAAEKSREHWKQIAKDAVKKAALLEHKIKNL